MRKNVFFERARFNRRSQHEGETAEKYIMELYRLSENCDYGEMRDDMIRDRLVVGIRDASLSQQLQLDADLNLEKTKQKIRHREAVSEQQRELKGASLEHTSLETVRFRKPKRETPTERRGKQNVANTSPVCRRCGTSQHPRSKCPAKDAVCHHCKKKGHYSSQCFSKQAAEITTSTSENIAFLDTASTTSQGTSAWFTKIGVNGRDLKFKLDTGAEVTAISKEDYKKLKKPPLSSPEKILYGPSQQTLKSIGQFLGEFSHTSKVIRQPIFVIDGLRTNLLGLPAITALGLAIRVDATESDTPPEEVQKEFPTVFQGLGNLGEEFEIHLKSGATPYCLFTPRNVPIPLRPKVQEELDRMESLGVIRKVDEPTPWCAGMVVVPKKEGAIRICVDSKPLNENVLREVHPLPKVDDTLAQLTGAKFFSKLDANSGFWQIPLAKKSQLLTTFVTPFGRYCFNKMPFGISSAPEHFQKRMSQILLGLTGALCLMDDVLVFGGDKSEHDQDSERS